MPIPAPSRRSATAFAACLGVLCNWPAWAAAPTAAAAPAQSSSFLGELLAILVALALIIVALLLILRLARRGHGLTGQDAPLSILQILPVGPRERIVLVRARSGRVFTIGVGTQSVNFITDLDPRDLTSPAPSVEPSNPAQLHTAGSR